VPPDTTGVGWEDATDDAKRCLLLSKSVLVFSMK
jgi:hypothetical protein